MWRFCCLGVEYYERSTTPLGKICAIGFEDWGQGRTNKQNIFLCVRGGMKKIRSKKKDDDEVLA